MRKFNFVNLKYKRMNKIQFLPYSWFLGIIFLMLQSFGASATSYTNISWMAPAKITTTSFTLSFSTVLKGNSMIKYGLTKSLEIGTVIDSQKANSHSVTLSGLTAGTFYYAEAISVDSYNDSSLSEVYIYSTASSSSGKIIVYFNNPVDTLVSRGQNAIYIKNALDDTVVAYINRAKYSIDIAIYDYIQTSLRSSIADALNEAYKRGVAVRVIGDGNTDNSGLSLISPYIYVIKSPKSDAVYGIMHNKFMIIDANSTNPEDPIVWTGSTNWDYEQLFQDFNNVIIIRDQSLAKAYTMEFNQMWGSDSTVPNSANEKFGPKKSDITPHWFNIGGKTIELYFSPSDATTSHAITAINTSAHELYWAINFLTRYDVEDAMLARAAAGINAAGVVGDTTYSPAIYEQLKSKLGKKVTNYKGYYIFHHKYFITDPNFTQNDPKVITGSHNWSTAAETQNDENIVIVHDSTIANLYYQEWSKRFAENGGIDITNVQTSVNPIGEINNGLKLDGYIFNPTSFSCQVNSRGSVSAEVYLTDLNGKLLAQKEINITDGNNNFEMQTGTFTQGVYLLSIRSGGGNSTYKVVKY